MLMVVLSTQGPSAQATGMDGKMDPATPLGPRPNAKMDPAREARYTCTYEICASGREPHRDLVIGVRRVGPARLDLFIVLREIGGDPRVWSLPCPPIPSRYAQRPTASLDEYSSQCSVRGVTDAGRVIVIHVFGVLSCSACPRTPALFVRARVNSACLSVNCSICMTCVLRVSCIHAATDAGFKKSSASRTNCACKQ